MCAPHPNRGNKHLHTFVYLEPLDVKSCKQIKDFVVVNLEHRDFHSIFVVFPLGADPEKVVDLLEQALSRVGDNE